MKSSFDSKSTRKTNKQTKTENVFFGRRERRVKIAVSILNLFSMLEVRENLKSEELTI